MVLAMVFKPLAKNSKHFARPPWRDCQLCISHGWTGYPLSREKRLAFDSRCCYFSHRAYYRTTQLNAKRSKTKPAMSTLL